MKQLSWLGVLFLAAAFIASAQEQDTTYVLPGLEITSTRKSTTVINEPMAITVIGTKDISKFLQDFRVE